jgi:hypothetical protein
MRRCVARFHPNGDREGMHMIVGYLTWREGRLDAFPEIEPADAPSNVFTTLRHLVRVAGQGSWERLLTLSCQQWSFVEAPPAR